MSTTRVLWVRENAYRQMEELAIESYPLETGGLLLGYESDDAVPVVTAITGPGPKARHRRHSFLPDTDYQQALLEAHHNATLGVESYLGDWHTHPDGCIALSRRDKKTLRNIAAAPGAYLKHPVMAILAPGKETWTLGAFRLNNWTDHLIMYRHDITSFRSRIFS